MITKTAAYEDGCICYTLYGLSTDTKPTENMTNASVFYEMDTKKVYMFCTQSKKWLEQ